MYNKFRTKTVFEKKSKWLNELKRKKDLLLTERGKPNILNI